MPDPHSTVDPISSSAPSRVALAPDSGPLDVDGRWWPHSATLPEELPVLLAAVSDRVGQVAVVGYPSSAWAAAPEYFDTAGGAVRLQGFASDDPNTLVLIGERGHALSLMVIAPDTPADTARRLLGEIGGSAADVPVVESIAERNTDRSLDDVAVRLARHAGQDDPEHAAVIAGWVQEAAAQFKMVPVQAFVPILVEHIVGARITAVRRSGPAGMPPR